MNWISTFYLRYAALNFSLIPVKTLAYAVKGDSNERDRDAKRALVKWKEFQKRRATQDEMLQWAKTWAHAGIAIVCGLLSDLIVVDDDRKGRPPLDGPRDEAQERHYQMLLKRYGSHESVRRAYQMADEFCEALEQLDTATSRTGKGRHFYFRLPRTVDGLQIPVGDTTKFLPGLDTRAEGGYVLAPPSIHPSGTSYIWEKPPEDGILELPHWVLQTIERFPNFMQYDVGGKYEPKQLHELVRRPTEPKWKMGQFGVAEGERNDTAASYCGKVIAECPDETLWDTKFKDIVIPWNENYNTPPIGIMELRATFDSVCKSERTKRGTTREQFYRTYAFGSEPELLTARAIGLADLRAPDYAVNGFIVDGTTQLFGKPKAGKSWLALQTAVAVATGTPLFPQSISMFAYANHPEGFNTHQGDVLYLALEDSYLRLQSRMKSVFGNANPETWPENLTFANAWAPCFDGGLLMIEKWIASVKHPRLVVADTIAAFMGAAGNDKGSVFRAEYRMFRPIWETSQRFKIPILLVDHASKGKGKFGSLDPFDAGAGTLGSQAAVDTAMIMEHSDKGPQARLYIKGRDVERGHLDIDHPKNSPVWRIAAPPIETAEEPKQGKNGKK